jgi:hypothetical protein
MILSHLISNLPNKFMILPLAVKKGAGEALHATPLGQLGCRVQTEVVAIVAAVRFSESYFPQKSNHVIFVPTDDLQAEMSG